MNADDVKLYRDACAADDAWHAELVRVYGKSAGDARYTMLGTATPTLAALHATFLLATAAWLKRSRVLVGLAEEGQS